MPGRHRTNGVPDKLAPSKKNNTRSARADRTPLWGAAGAGEVSLAPAAGGIHAAATSWRMAAAGLRGDLLGGGAGPALAVVSDALWTRTASDSGASRLRLGLEGRWELPVPGGGRLTPSLEAGARRDGGDAETGLGVELGGAYRGRTRHTNIASHSRMADVSHIHRGTQVGGSGTHRRSHTNLSCR